MTSKHMATKRKLREISDLKTFDDLLNSVILSETEKEIMRNIYIQKKSFSYTGDILGYSEEGIKKIHRKILKKISRLI